MKRITPWIFTWLILGALMGVALPLLFAGESAAHNPDLLRVGVTPNLPPMIFKEGKKITGVEADFAQILGRELGCSIRFIELSWPDLIDALEASKIDIIMSSMSVTRTRQARVAFSEPYLRISQMALVRAEEQYRYVILNNSFASQTIGLRKGTTSDLLVQQEFPRAKRRYYDSGDQAAKALMRKRIDLYLSDSPMIWYLASKHEAEGLAVAPMLFTEEALAWAVRRSDTNLVESANKTLKSMNANGELRQVLKRWIPKYE